MQMIGKGPQIILFLASQLLLSCASYENDLIEDGTIKLETSGDGFHHIRNVHVNHVDGWLLVSGRVGGSGSNYRQRHFNYHLDAWVENENGDVVHSARLQPMISSGSFQFRAQLELQSVETVHLKYHRAIHDEPE